MRKLNPTMKGPIRACRLRRSRQDLAGALDRDIAGRKFVRISLGGVRDEAEIRGHRRTYIGALPGQIIQGLRRAESKNRCSSSTRSTSRVRFPRRSSSALLEVLDPEQNSTFANHYLDVLFDLSEVLFITTRTWLDTIPPPLRDRMEVLELHGYTRKKARHARDHLVTSRCRTTPEQGAGAFTDAGLRAVTACYTREAGVRNLEREIGAICRKIARRVRRRRRSRQGDEESSHELLARPDTWTRRSRTAPRIRPWTWHEWKPVGGECSSSKLAHGGQRSLTRPVARRRDEGIGTRRAVVGCARIPRSGRSIHGIIQEFRAARQRAVGRDPEGWSVGRA